MAQTPAWQAPLCELDPQDKNKKKKKRDLQAVIH